MENSFLQRQRAQSELRFALRSWFYRYGYAEVNTPCMVSSPAMEEHLEAIQIPEYHSWLHTSPEFAMKKLLAQGHTRIYQLAHCFRKEELGIHHKTEFEMLEWYRVGASYWDLMEETENLVQYLYETVGQPPPVFTRIPTRDLLPLHLAPDEWFFRWVDEIEPHLPPACIVYDYPAWQSALARIRGDIACRFEIYIHGVELANAFDEEADPAEIRIRWTQNNHNRSQVHKHPYPIDEDFLQALPNMPRCSGIAMGWDRLVMLILGQHSIHE